MSVSSKIRPGAPSPRGGGIAVRQFSLRRREELRPQSPTLQIYRNLWCFVAFPFFRSCGSRWVNRGKNTWKCCPQRPSFVALWQRLGGRKLTFCTCEDRVVNASFWGFYPKWYSTRKWLKGEPTPAWEGLRPSGGAKDEFPVETWPPLNLLFLVLGNLDSCKQERGRSF